MLDLENFMQSGPYSLGSCEKEALLGDTLRSLCFLHYQSCHSYRKIVDTLKIDLKSCHQSTEIPYLPVRLFKEFDLMSVPPTEIRKTMLSSGTTSDNRSRIYLDSNTSSLQTRALAKIMSHFLGSARLPMLVIDSRPTLGDRNEFSAQRAAIMGFSVLGRNHMYALNETLALDFDRVFEFCKKNSEKLLIFGFTSMVWKHFYQPLMRLGMRLPMQHSVLIHGGGWKKLVSELVDNQAFKAGLKTVCGVKRVHNYYGMVEQTGSIYMECEEGFLHCSIFSDVIVRNANLAKCQPREIGLVQSVSVLPASYPGHSILTEDLGEIYGEDNCRCGKLGKYFRVLGRAPSAETRGCSDTTSN